MLPQNAIFISYRISDSQDVTGRIYDRLARHFGTDVVFRDLYSIDLGTDYRQVLKDNMQRCRVMVAVIGPTWLSVTNDAGRRLDDPNDWVRLEIATALQRDIPVIPVLVGGARLPQDSELPEPLQPLAYRQAALARSTLDFETDMTRLIHQLEKILAASAPPPTLTRGQTLKLDYLNGQLADLEKQLLMVQQELGATMDVLIAGKLEKRQALLFEQIDDVDREIQQLKSNNGRSQPSA